MTDNLPGLSGDMGAGKSITRAEFAKRERERKALELWTKGRSYTQIKNAMNLRNTDAARKLVEAGEVRWKKEEGGAMVRHIAAQVNRLYEIIDKSREGIVVRDKDGNPVIGKDGEVVREVSWGAVDREMKAWDRLSRLLGLDAVRESEGGGQPTYILQAGGDITLVPKGGEVIDTRPPWERGEIIEGEVEE